MLKPSYPYYLGNVAVTPNTDLEVKDKFSGEVATRVAMADAQAIAKGIDMKKMAAENEFKATGINGGYAGEIAVPIGNERFLISGTPVAVQGLGDTGAVGVGEPEVVVLAEQSHRGGLVLGGERQPLEVEKGPAGLVLAGDQLVGELVEDGPQAGEPRPGRDVGGGGRTEGAQVPLERLVADLPGQHDRADVAGLGEDAGDRPVDDRLPRGLLERRIAQAEAPAAGVLRCRQWPSCCQR